MIDDTRFHWSTPLAPDRIRPGHTTEPSNGSEP